MAVATLNREGASQRNTREAAPVIANPFTRASFLHTEPTGYDTSRVLTGADVDLGTQQIPAYGYIRSILILVQATGAAAGAAVVAFQPDAPFNAIKSITFQEPNGFTIHQFNSGHDLYLADKWGGYRGVSDPRALPAFSTDAAGNFSFLLRIPIELSVRDGVGSLPNLNSGALYQLRATLAGSGAIYSTAPATTLPTVRVRTFLEAWAQPDEEMNGRPNEAQPPGSNTTQMWTPTVFEITAGQNTKRLTRVGNLYREMILVYRDAAGSRTVGETNWPDSVELQYDTQTIETIQDDVWRSRMAERSGYGVTRGTVTPGNEAAGGLDNGVRVLDFAHDFDGMIGNEMRDLYLETRSSTRLELRGDFGVAGTLTVLTNDIVTAGDIFMEGV